MPHKWQQFPKTAAILFDEALGITGYYTVTQVWTHQDPVAVYLTIDGEVLETTRTITYDNLYRLTNASYTSGEQYQYQYDPVGNRTHKTNDQGQVTNYQYDEANRLQTVDGQAYQWDNNGNLLSTGDSANTFDAANRLITASRDGHTVAPIYNGLDDRVGQSVDGQTTYFALDVATNLPEVIYTSEDNAYLHLPGVIMTQSAAGEVRYLLSDGLASIRQTVDENGDIAGYQEFDPYGTPIVNHQSEIENPYGFTGEWWQREVDLLHLRARWYAPADGIFLSRDPVESEPPYQYVGGNPVNFVDPSGHNPCPDEYQYNGRADGYAMGVSTSFSALFMLVEYSGREVVWDYATLEKMDFDVIGEYAGLNTTIVGISEGGYLANIWGFKTKKDGGKGLAACRREKYDI